MNLKAYLRSLSKEQKESFAISCGCTLQHLKFVAYRAKQASESLAIAIERETGGLVTVEETRPDLIDHWTYIRGTAKRPEFVPEPQAA
jgi:DNA-binding transcriptional regulator YdaS (Cro superfamily)